MTWCVSAKLVTLVLVWLWWIWGTLIITTQYIITPLSVFLWGQREFIKQCHQQWHLGSVLSGVLVCDSNMFTFPEADGAETPADPYGLAYGTQLTLLPPKPPHPIFTSQTQTHGDKHAAENTASQRPVAWCRKVDRRRNPHPGSSSGLRVCLNTESDSSLFPPSLSFLSYFLSYEMKRSISSLIDSGRSISWFGSLSSLISADVSPL